MAYSPVVFSFDDMIFSLRSAMKQFTDLRTGKNTQYEIVDVASGAFSVFFTQCPSFLAHQKLMEKRYGLSNAKTLFGIQKIPSDNHIRNLLDIVKPELLSSVFTDCFTAMQKSGDLDTFRILLGRNNKDLLVALDGTTYQTSCDISCSNCSKKNIDGETMYAHSVVTPTIVAPGVNKVLSLMPEFITPQDGDSKQDCELKASKRWLVSNTLKDITILGDDLYAHEPFCKDLLDKKHNFILVCKPQSHKTLYEWINGILKETVEDRFDGKTHQIYSYRYAQAVPLRDSIKKTDEVLLVNFIEVTVKDRKTGKQLYHNAFITNHPLTDKTLSTIIDCGRARWKIENENNNTLKRFGYNLEHNFGHGKKYLASILATMNILAFLFHTMLEYMDEKYRLLRKVFGSRRTFFNHIRTLLVFHPYKSFGSLMDFMIEGLENPIPLEELRYPL